MTTDCNNILDTIENKDTYQLPDSLRKLEDITHVFQFHFDTGSTSRRPDFILNTVLDPKPMALPPPSLNPTTPTRTLVPQSTNQASGNNMLLWKKKTRVKDGGITCDIIWNDDVLGSGLDVAMDLNINEGPLYLKYYEEEDERGSSLHLSKRNMGRFHILIFLPPTSHLLFQMEVGVGSTLVRIRTDHWPCLAYIDDYLEALFLA
ncbi:AP-5 complex subunit beta-1 like protein [Tanacetum coccineum]